MSLIESNIIGFIPSANLDAAAVFYSQILGLKLVNSNEYALEYEVKQTKLRITKVSEVARASYTIFGWEVNNIISVVEELGKKELISFATKTCRKMKKVFVLFQMAEK